MARVIAAGDFASDGERKAAAVLQSLPDNWLVVSNKLLVSSSGRSFEIDFIVVGSRCIFVIDEKSWRGRIIGTDQVWVRADGSSERSPLNKVDYVSRVLKGELIRKVAALNVQEQFVFGCVLLTADDVAIQLRDPRAPKSVFQLKHAVDHLVSRDGVEGIANVGPSLIPIERCLVNLEPRPRVPKKIGLYEIGEVRDLRAGVRVMEANLPGAGERRLLVYETTQADSEFVLREFKALQKLKASGVAVDVGDPFPWSDDFVVLPLSRARGQSIGSLPALDFVRDAMVVELRTCLASFEALAVIHKQGLLHRAIDPDAVFVDLSDVPTVQFGDFHAARLGSRSIAQQLDEENELLPYAAPELASGFASATVGSDVFSLALVYAERMTGIAPQALRVAPPDGAALDLWNTLRDGLAGDLAAFFELALGAAPAPGQPAAAGRPTAQDCVELLQDMVGSVGGRGGGPGQGTAFDHRYELIRKLGEGSSAFTYLVRDLEFGGFFAVKRFKRASAVIEQAKNEFEALRGVHSPFLPRVYDIYPAASDIHLKMEYIEGATLADLVSTMPWPVEKWLDLARPLFQAVAVLEGRGLLHRDIKPANVVLRESDDAPVLVDFGFSTIMLSNAPAAGTPRYIPPEAVTSARPPSTSDRYALGVLLGDVLFGPADASGAELQANPEPESERMRRLRAFLQTLTERDPNKRYQSTASALEALDGALAVTELAVTGAAEVINPWIEQLRRTYRNSALGNQDNRGLDTPFARDTYVETALDRVLLPSILRDRPRAVFLSGNPGDGKTSFLEMFEAHLRGTGALREARDESGWKYQSGQHRFLSCFDASESHGVLTADQQLDSKIESLAGDQPPAIGVTALIAINDGRLHDFLARFDEKYAWLHRAVNRALEVWTHTDPVWVIDLKRRSLVAADEHGQSVMTRLMDVLVDPSRWQACEPCVSFAICPMRRNALDLSGRGPTATARARFENLVRLAHLRLVRHITMRDLRSTLAFLITGDSSCEEIHAERRGDAPPQSLRRWFWRSLFDGPHDDDPLRISLAMMDPAASPTPQTDRFLGARRTAEYARERAALFVDEVDVDPDSFSSVAQWIASFKRRLFFLGRDGPRVAALTSMSRLQALLPYRHTEEFAAALTSQEACDRALPFVLRGVTQSDGVVLASGEFNLSLKVSSSERERLVVVKQFPSQRFRLVPLRPGETPLETAATSLVLELREPRIAVRITLDLYELIRRMAAGLRPDADEFRPLLADLVPFKNALLLQETEQLVLIENGIRAQHVVLEAGKVVRRQAAT